MSGLKVWFDGGCRPNPGPIEVAAVARGASTVRDDIGHGSNGDAEWLALLHGLDVAAALGASDVILLGDSLSVVRQASGREKCRSEAGRTHLAAFHERAAGFERVRVRHVGRSQNLAGIVLERRHLGLGS